MSNCHPQVYYDAKSLVKVSSRVQYTSARPLNSVLQALAPSRETLQARYTLLGRLREIIKSDMGDDFDVEDISMRNYADDLDIAPMELMIVVRAVMSLTWDCCLLTGRPRTFISRPTYFGVALTSSGPQSPRRASPWHEIRQPPQCLLPEVACSYCAHGAPLLTCGSRLAAFLQDHGFDGVIPSADVPRRDNIQGNRKRGDPPPPIRTEDGAFRWPRYTRTPKPEIVYPAVLEATTPEPFGLSLPCPTIRHTRGLLHLYSRRNPHLRLMTSLTYIWMRSWDIKEINPQTLCLLLIRFFQVKHTLTSPNSDFL